MGVSEGALAAQTDVLALMSALKRAGAQILPEVWHRETMRYVATTAAAEFPAAAAGAKSGAHVTSAGAKSGAGARSGAPKITAGAKSGASESNAGARSGTKHVALVASLNKGSRIIFNAIIP